MDLIIYSNPDQVNGHSAALLGFVKTRLSEKGLAYEVIDLYADNFDPVLKQEELRGRPSDRLVLSYQEKISRASRLIFIFPVWWYTTPAILKGFIDRVFSAGFAYNFKKAPQVPEILNPVLGFLAGRKSLYGIFMSNLPVEQKLRGKKAIVINTFGGSELGFRMFGSAPEYTVDKAVLNFCGIVDVRRIHWFEARGPPQIPVKVKSQIDGAL